MLILIDNLLIATITFNSMHYPGRTSVFKFKGHFLICVVIGRMSVVVNGEPVTLAEKQVYFSNPGSPLYFQYGKNDLPLEFFVLRFRYGREWVYLPAGVYDIADQPQILTRIRQIMTERRLKNISYQEKNKALLAEILIDMRRLKQAADFPSQTLSPSVQKALHYIYANLSRDLTPAIVSTETGYSHSYFAQRFKAETGTPLKHYILQQKIRKAKDFLIYRKENMGWIAERCGYANVNDFSRHFKKVVGMPPLAFRKRIVG